jgi:hypothetical protein
MKLKKIWSREYKGKKYYKYSVIIPAKAVKELGWKAGERLKGKTSGRTLVVEKK